MEIRFDWPKIHDSVLFETANGEKCAQTAARRIEYEIEREGTPRGETVGTSPELCERFGLGKETLLEAARLLEDRGVAQMRRGPRGGLISMGRAVTDPARLLQRYLAGAGITIDQIHEARNVFALLDLYDHQVRHGRGDDFAERFHSLLIGNRPVLGELVPAPAPAGAVPNRSLQPFVDALDALLVAAKTAEAAADDGRGHGLVRLATEYLAGEVARMRRLGVDRLGSESQIAERIGISRQVLRQAIGLLEDQGLLICRRGRSNGIVTAAAHPAGIVRSVGDAYARAGLGEDEFRHVQTMLERVNRILFAERAEHFHFGLLQRTVENKVWEKPDTHIRRMHVEWPVINNPALSLLEQVLSGYRARRAGNGIFIAVSDIDALRRRMFEHIDLMRRRDLAGADRCYVDMHGQVTVLLKGH